MPGREEIRILTRSAFSGLLVELHKNPMEQESDLVEVATANYLRLLHSKGVVRKVDRELDTVLCKKMLECGYKHNCSHAKHHIATNELCRHYSIIPCSCRTSVVAIEPLINT